MFCKNCGKEIDDNAYVCLNCGAKVKEEGSSSVDNPSNVAGVVSCCFPIVGLILYFLWKDEKPKSAKLVCYWMLGGLAAWVILYIIMFGLGLLGAIL